MPKPNPATFFSSPQGAAILKHGILRRYLVPFVSKVGSTSTGHRVVYIDTHAGGGTYDDGTPGSPSLAMLTANAVATYRNMDCMYVEEDSDQVKRLQLALKGHQCEIIDGKLEDSLDYLIDRASGAPALWFIDPFGLALPFDDMVRILKRLEPTELILNVAISAIRRTAGLSNPKALDAMMGGDWWRPIWDAGADRKRERDAEIVFEYRKRLGAAANYFNWHVEVSDFPEKAPAYYLTFFTRHWDGVWVFLDSTSTAIPEQREWCFAQASMMDVDAPDYDERLIAVVKSNLAELVGKNPTGVRLERKANEVYSGVMGRARRSHITKAWDLLAKDGAVQKRPSLPKSGIQSLTIYSV